MAPIKVAHVTTIDQALDFLLLHQLLSLQERGFEVVGISSPGKHVAIVEKAGIRHVAVPMTRKWTPLADLAALARLTQVMRRERFHIVHTHTPKAGLLAPIAARMAGVPIVIYTLHGLYFHEHMSPFQRRFYIRLEKLTSPFYDSVLSQNRADISTVIQVGIYPPEKVKYLGNGIDLSVFNPSRFTDMEVLQMKTSLGIAADAPVVGYVGRLAAKRKGLLHLLAAAQKVLARAPHAKFLFIGEPDPGKDDAITPEIATHYGLQASCLFLGYRANIELPLLYRVMDFLVLPSLWEGIPRVIMESAAMGIPSVASDVRGNQQLVENGKTGLLVPFGHADALAEAINQLLANPKQRQEMGQRACRRAATEFDERTVFQRVSEEYAFWVKKKGLERELSSF